MTNDIDHFFEDLADCITRTFKGASIFLNAVANNNIGIGGRGHCARAAGPIGDNICNIS